MHPHTTLRIQRKTEVIAQMGICITTLRTRIQQGLYPPPINLGARAVGWLAHETEAVIAATAAGHGDDEIRCLVGELMQQRAQLGEQYHAHR